MPPLRVFESSGLSPQLPSMRKKSTNFAETKAPDSVTSAARAKHERQVHNRILRDLPAKDRDLVLSKSQHTELPVRSILNDMGEPIKSVYFVDSGLASILNVMPDGKSVEVGLAGAEGFVGLPLIVGFKTSATQAVMQIAGA